MKFGVILLALLATPPMAEPNTPPSNSILIRNVISAVGPSWNTAGNYKAVLMREGEYAALYIFRGPYDEAPMVYAPHAAVTGDYWATIPWLEFDEGGTLLLHSENRAYGRNKWESTLSIVERNNKFIVSSYNLSAYNSLNPDNFTDCTINMLTRKLIVNEIEITPFPLPAEVQLKDWSEGLEGVCYRDYAN